ncbi:trichohyalin-like isoform X3 [Penaeus monodon]|uniref:trichohyalin-like isoform X3 n=1 Tax=Penaeus monodon TaxID=6687 RepID=UPI0018A7CD47|nr:trichohyalin-like isoform X3 [Penaeus monodon]
MSSESEDEFQSADEGSDFEDSYPLNSQVTATTRSEAQLVSSCPAPTKEVVKDNMHKPASIKDTKTECSEPVVSKATPAEEFDADDESEEEIHEEPQTKTFDDKVTNLMSALDQLSVRVNKQLTKPVSKAEPVDEMLEEDEDEGGHKGSVEEDQAKEREILKEDERKRELEKEKEKKRELEMERERKRELEKEEERKREVEREEKRKQELEREEEKKREIEREVQRKREIEREKEKKRQIEKEEERQRQLEQEELRKRELEKEERRKEHEREELRKEEIEKEKRKMEREEEAKRMEEEERKRALEKEEDRKREIKSEQERKEEQEKNAGNTQDSGTESQKAKPIRESKIGMKKPREKLGERMGARRLGAKVEKKPLESISSDNFKKPEDTMWNKEESQTDSAEAKQREEEKQKQEKWRKQQQWEEQQKRWQQINEGEDKKEQEEDTSWGGGWGGWGTSLLTAASTFTREVGRGVGTVMETVEGTLGVPDAETMAREIVERDKELKGKLAQSEQSASREKTPDSNAEEEPEPEKTGDTPSSGSAPSNQTEGNAGYVPSYGLSGLSSLGSLVSGVSGALETASSKVLMGGLDTLEVIGRKAMTVIQEGDPGLRKKRAFLTSSKPNLSMILQDARQRAAQEESDQRDGIHNKESGLFRRPNFDQAWENTEGPVHVEALSLVAKQCESKMNTLLQSMPPYLVDRIQNSNLSIKKTCEMDEESQLEGDFATQVTKIVSQIRLPLHSQKIREAWAGVEETASLIEEKKNLDWAVVEKEVYLSLALLIAQLAALTHKGSELALITPGSEPHAIANSFRELSCLVCAGMENTVDNICSIITAKASAADPDVNNTITNIYLQGASGNSCVQEGMMFLSSVLQYANTKLLAADL